MNKMNIVGKRGIGKRGQVTLFIIAGIVILFAAFFIGYIQNESFRQKIESELFGVSVVPEQAKGVVDYANNCIERIARDGVELLGFQGGYIEIPNSISFNPRAYLRTDPIYKAPYWIYGRGNVDVPTIQEMEDQLERYIDRRFNSECGFNEFPDYDFSTKQIESEAGILNGKISVKLKSEIDVGIKENIFPISDYIGIDVPIDLKMLYNMAVDIVNRELRRSEIGNAPFEAMTIDLIAAYAKDKNSLISIPPIAEFNYECNPNTWTLNEVRENIEEYLGTISRLFRVEGANNDVRGEFYNSLIIGDVFSGEHDDTIVSFNYNPGWAFFLDVYPRDGNVLKPSTLKLGLPFIPLFCFTNHNFRYTLQYPLMVNLENDNFAFRFPIEIYIIDNFGGRLIDGDVVSVEDEAGGLFCDENQKLSEAVVVESIDALTSNALDDINVVYVCGVNNCVVGKTKIENGRSVLEEEFPLCRGGEIILSKDGYGEFYQELDTYNTGRNSAFAAMKPYVNKKVEVRVLELKDGNVLERELMENEQASVRFTVLDLGRGSFKEGFALLFNGNEILETPLLFEEQYNVAVDLILNEEITIPGGEFQGREVPDQKVEGVFLGGADFETYISLDDLEKDKIIVLALSRGIPRNFEDYIENSDVKSLSEKHF